MEGCLRTYDQTPTGLGGDTNLLHPDGKDSKGKDRYKPSIMQPGYNLRPEVIESLFVLWRVTKKKRYREAGWKIFESISEHCAVEGSGFSGLVDANVLPLGKAGLTNSQPSFFMAETLKYLYLLFSEDDVIPLEEYVFTTQGHPLSIKPRCSQEHYAHLGAFSHLAQGCTGSWGFTKDDWPWDVPVLLFLLTVSFMAGRKLNRKLGKLGCSRKHRDIVRRKRDQLVRALIFGVVVTIGPLVVVHSVEHYTQQLKTGRSDSVVKLL